MKKESWFWRLLKWLGIIEEVEVRPSAKKQMCENAKSICNRNCSNCAWYDGDAE